MIDMLDELGLKDVFGTMVVYNRTTGLDLRIGTPGIERTATEEEDFFLLGPGESVRGMMVDVERRCLIPLPEEHVPDDSPIIWERVRRMRDALLAQTDYLMIPDSPIDNATRERVRLYRQALRDLTKQPDPRLVEWPAHWSEDK
jgi:hypothetical protein